MPAFATIICSEFPSMAFASREALKRFAAKKNRRVADDAMDEAFADGYRGGTIVMTAPDVRRLVEANLPQIWDRGIVVN